MDDLISRATLKQQLITHYEVVEQDISISEDFRDGATTGLDAAMFEIDNTSAVDAVPVIHAYWVEEPDRVNHWHCSNCGCPVGIASIAYRYCYVCGAKMAEHPRAADGCGQAFSPD